MRIDQLLHIVEVSKTKSINRAAANCFISHQSLCYTIRSVEQKFGIQLFRRSPHGVTLTDTGEKFVRLAQEILDKVNEMEDLQQEFASENVSSFVRFFHVPNLNTSTHAENLAQFCCKYPNIKVTVTEKSSDEIIKAVTDTPDALGLLALPKWEFTDNLSQNKDIKARFLFQEKLQICVGASYPLHRKNVSICQMLKHPWAIFEYSETLSTETWLERYGKPNVYMRTNNPELFRKLIRDNLAVGMVIESTSGNKQFINDKIRFIPLRESIEDLEFCFYVVFSARHNLSPGAEFFVESLMKNAPQTEQIKKAIGIAT